MERVECAVIGGGPAGTAAAYHLARAGVRAVLFEKARYPRVKPCGGLVSPEVAHWFPFSFEPVISTRVSRVRYTWFDRSIELELSETEPIWMVRREKFDTFLAERAAEAGADVRDGCPVLDWSREADGYRLETEHGLVLASTVIWATGSKGPAHRLTGLGQTRYRLAAAIEAEARTHSIPDPVLVLELGRLENGYLWSFPKADGCGIGGGAFPGPSVKLLRRIAADYCRTQGFEWESCEVCGHPIHVWDGRQRLDGWRCVLAGEAASIVDPLTAEGIRPSLKTGMIAAQSVVQALSSSRPEDLACHSRAVHQEWGADMVWARRVARLFYRAPEKSFEYLCGRPSATRAFGRVLSGETRYRDVARQALSKMVPVLGREQVR